MWSRFAVSWILLVSSFMRQSTGVAPRGLRAHLPWQRRERCQWPPSRRTNQTTSSRNHRRKRRPPLPSRLSPIPEKPNRFRPILISRTGARKSCPASIDPEHPGVLRQPVKSASASIANRRADRAFIRSVKSGHAAARLASRNAPDPRQQNALKLANLGLRSRLAV